MADGDLDDPIDYGSQVRNNLMKRPDYTPYCGGSIHMVRAQFNGKQFRCYCGWESEFPEDFIEGYKARWSL